MPQIDQNSEMKILFICRSNVGRSQMASALFNKVAPGCEVKSAGIQVMDKDGNSRDGQKLKDLSAAEHVIGVLKEEGIDAEEFVRRQLTPEMAEWADKIVVMAEPETIPDYLKDSPKIAYWDVKDPKGTSFEIHRETKEKIKELVNELRYSVNNGMG